MKNPRASLPSAPQPAIPKLDFFLKCLKKKKRSLSEDVKWISVSLPGSPRDHLSKPRAVCFPMKRKDHIANLCNEARRESSSRASSPIHRFLAREGAVTAKRRNHGVLRYLSVLQTGIGSSWSPSSSEALGAPLEAEITSHFP